jgi:hypothetical protein
LNRGAKSAEFTRPPPQGDLLGVAGSGFKKVNYRRPDANSFNDWDE